MSAINFEEGFESKEKAKEVVATIQKTIDDLVLANEQTLAHAKSLADDLTAMEELNKNAIQSSMSLSEALKNIHIELNSKMELISQDPELLDLTKKLGEWVMGSGAIKLGVLSNDESK